MLDGMTQATKTELGEARPGGLVRALRTVLRLTQGQMARRGQIRPEEASRVEGGSNKLSSHVLRLAIAKGLGLAPPELDKLLAGDVTVEDLAMTVLAREPDIATKFRRATQEGGSP